mmetsp:Transcript_9101/g.15033  ORF Transcript_9101/g.15033 Transcript_9101/m.15033 type:complete len:621 (+) Transcript_9101:93-1955(+)
MNCLTAALLVTAVLTIADLGETTHLRSHPVKENCHLVGDFYSSVPRARDACIEICSADQRCQGFTWKHVAASGGAATSNCTGQIGQPCCYFQSKEEITGHGPEPRFDCWEKAGIKKFALGTATTEFPHFWEAGINSPHSAITLRADWREQMRQMRTDIGYNYTRIHAPFSRDFSVSQGPNATSYYNAFSTYDFLLSIGVKPWIELGYTPCWMSGPAAVASDTYWPTVDYGLCVGPPTSMALWTDMIREYVGAMIKRYGLAEVETWRWVLFNEPSGINAYNEAWQTSGFSYYEMFFNTSQVIKSYSDKIQVGGLSDSPEQATKLMQYIRDVPQRANLLDFFTYHRYCNDKTGVECGESHTAIVTGLRQSLPSDMPIFLEETGSSAGPYDKFHDTTGEAAFVVPYVASLSAAGLSGAHWWVSSDLYTEHGNLPNYTWIPHQSWSGGMPRAEFTGRWGFRTPSGVAKPIYRAFQLLAFAGRQRIAVSELFSGAASCLDSVQVLAVANGTSQSIAGEGAMIFVSNAGVAPCNVSVELGQWRSHSQGWLHRIDEQHTNPYGEWLRAGSPPFPTPAEIKALNAASRIGTEHLDLSSSATLELVVPSDGLHVLAIGQERTLDSSVLV